MSQRDYYFMPAEETRRLALGEVGHLRAAYFELAKIYEQRAYKQLACPIRRVHRIS